MQAARSTRSTGCRHPRADAAGRFPGVEACTAVCFLPPGRTRWHRHWVGGAVWAWSLLDSSGVGVELLVFPPATHPHSDVLDVGDEFDALDPFDHFETELGFKPESYRGAVFNGQRRAIHLQGQKGLSVP